MLSKVSQNYLSYCIETLFADREWWKDDLIMPPTLKKLEGHIASGAFVRPSACLPIHPFVTLFDA